MFRAVRFALALSLPAALMAALPASPAAAAAPYTSWEMRSQTGDYVGGGASYSYLAPGDTISASGTSAGVNTAVNAANGDWWYASFAPPVGGALQPGTTYTSALRFADASHPGLDVSGNGRGCNQTFGEFTVHEAAFDGVDGALTKFSATFAQHCESTGAPLLRGVIAWNADAAPPALPQPTKLTLTTAKARYPYRATVKVIATLTSGSPNRAVSIYATPYGGTKRLVKTANVGLDGKLVVSVAVTQRTTFTAAYAGDANFDPSSASRVVTVSAKVDGAMKRYVAKSGKYFVYPASKPAFLLSHVSPNHAGDCLRFLAQVYFRGSWQKVGQLKCGRMDARSYFLAGFEIDRSAIGYPFRMHAVWGGDAQSAPATGKWHYFKFRG